LASQFCSNIDNQACRPLLCSAAATINNANVETALQMQQLY